MLHTRVTDVVMPDQNLPLGDEWKDQMSHFMKTSGKTVCEWYTNNKELARRHSQLSRKEPQQVDELFWELCMCAPIDVSRQDKDFPTSLLVPSNTQKIFEFFVFSESRLLLDYEGLLFGVPIDQAVILQNQITRRLALAVGERAFCITEKGYMALAPPLSMKKDILVHIRGGYVPGVLRKVPLTPENLEWVGACYVHGVSDVYSGTDWENNCFV